MSSTIKINSDDMAKVRTMLAEVKGAPERVSKRAIDRTMGTVKTTVSRVARETLNVLKRDLDPFIGVKKFDNATNSGAVVIAGESLPIFDFGWTQAPSGISVKIKKRGPTKLLTGAFFAQMKSGHAGIFWREWHDFRTAGKAKQPPWKKLPRKYRLKIHEIFTTSLPDALGDKIPMDQILADADDNLHENIERELNYELSKL